MSEEHPTPREDLEREADGARTRLLDTLAALDRRRRRILSPMKQARRYALPLAGVGVAMLVGLAGGEALARRSLRRRQELLARHGLSLGPGQAAEPTTEPMFPQIVRRVAVTLLSALLGHLARRALAARLLPEGDHRRAPPAPPSDRMEEAPI